MARKKKYPKLKAHAVDAFGGVEEITIETSGRVLISHELERAWLQTRPPMIMGHRLRFFRRPFMLVAHEAANPIAMPWETDAHNEEFAYHIQEQIDLSRAGRLKPLDIALKKQIMVQWLLVAAAAVFILAGFAIFGPDAFDELKTRFGGGGNIVATEDASQVPPDATPVPQVASPVPPDIPATPDPNIANPAPDIPTPGP